MVKPVSISEVKSSIFSEMSCLHFSACGRSVFSGSRASDVAPTCCVDLVLAWHVRLA